MGESSAVLQFLRKLGRATRLRGPASKEPTAQILRALLVGVLSWGLFDVAVIIPLHAANKLVSTAQASCGLLIVASTLVLRFRGSLRPASLVYLSGIWVLATIAIEVTAGRPLAIWASIVAAMIITSVCVARIVQVCQDALAELREHQKHLEELVEERTAELIRARGLAQAAISAQYVYRNDAPQANDSPLLFRPESFSGLSLELRDQLEEALVSLDVRRIAELISTISEQDLALSGLLVRCVDRFEYTPILNALRRENCKTASA